MKTRLFYVCLMLLISTAVYSQFIDSLRYFPLQIGNKWFYTTCTNSGPYTDLIMEIQDTIILNNHKYYKTHTTYWNGAFDDYYREDALIGRLFYYNEYYPECNFEHSYNLKAGINDTSYYCSPYDYTCVSIKDTALFGYDKSIKKFYQPKQGSFQEGSLIVFGKDFGIVFSFTTMTPPPDKINILTEYRTFQYLRAARINGVLYGDTVFSGIIKIGGTFIPSVYTLSQNYPNPFNPTTKIKFDIPLDDPKGSHRFRGNDKVVLKVYDVMGREVQTLVNERLQPGKYEVSFDGSMLNSGFYFCKLITGGYTQTKKMLLIK